MKPRFSFLPSLLIVLLLAFTAPAQSFYEVPGGTGSNATVVVVEHDGPVPGGDEICLFGEADTCFGAAVFQDRHFHITAWGDNVVTPAVDGFTAGETYRFRTFNTRVGRELTLTPHYREGPESFVQDGITIIDKFALDDEELLGLIEELQGVVTSLQQQLEAAQAALEPLQTRVQELETERSRAVAALLEILAAHR